MWHTYTQILFVVKLRRDIDYYLATLRRHKGHRNQPMGSEIKSSQSVIFPPDTWFAVWGHREASDWLMQLHELCYTSVRLPTSTVGPDTLRMIRTSMCSWHIKRYTSLSRILAYTHIHTHYTEYHISIYTHHPCRQGSLCPFKHFWVKAFFSWINSYFFVVSAPSGKAHSTDYSLSGWSILLLPPLFNFRWKKGQRRQNWSRKLCQRHKGARMSLAAMATASKTRWESSKARLRRHAGGIPKWRRTTVAFFSVCVNTSSVDFNMPVSNQKTIHSCLVWNFARHHEAISACVYFCKWETGASDGPLASVWR